MPITNTLETTRKLEQAGFPPKQADVLSGLFEDSARATQQDLKSFIVEQLAALESRMDSKMDARFAQLVAKLDVHTAQIESKLDVHVAQTESRISQSEVRLLREMRQQMVWFTGLLIAIAAASIGLAKLLFG